MSPEVPAASTDPALSTPPTTRTAEFCASMREAADAPLPPQVAYAARRTLFNVLGTAIGAAGSSAVAALIAAAREQRGDGAAGVPGRPETLDPYWAALVAGTAAHLDDFDDTHLATVIHPGAATLAAVLALAPETGVSGSALLSAFAIGCEAQLRIGNAISPDHYDRGWHITGTCGVLGAAVASSLLLGLDAAGIGRVLSLASTMTLGHREAFGSMTKAFHAGKAAANALLAARLAAATSPPSPPNLGNLTGPPELTVPADPLGPGGVLDVLAGTVDRGALAKPDPTRGWELELNTFKPYPCGVVAHPAIDAAIELSARIGDPALITAIEVTCNPLVPELMGVRQPADGLQARFSARHAIAVGLIDGRAGLAQFTDQRAAAPEVARLRDVITLVPDPACARDAVTVRIGVRDGRPEATTMTEHVAHCRGSLARPLTEAELLDKVRRLADPVLGSGAGDRLREAIDGLTAAPDAAALLAAIRPGGHGTAATR
jgi:2-methylcitrate dehydratase PrpD